MLSAFGRSGRVPGSCLRRSTGEVVASRCGVRESMTANKEQCALASVTRVSKEVLEQLMPWAYKARKFPGVKGHTKATTVQVVNSTQGGAGMMALAGQKTRKTSASVMNIEHCLHVNKKCDKDVLFLWGSEKVKVKKVIGNEKLKVLEALVPQVLLKSHAENTNKSYNRVFQLWKNWAEKFGVRSMPAEDYFVALFLIDLGQTSCSAANIRCAIPAIVWGHRMAGVVQNFETQFLRDISCGLRRTYAKPRNPSDLIKCVELANLEVLKELRSVTIMVLSFMGFFRFNEVNKLKWSDIIFREGYIEVSIRRSKTDQLREGNKVLIAQSVSKACSVTLMKKYLEVTKEVLGSDFYIFRALSNKNGLRAVNKPMSYTSVREVVAEQFLKLGLDPKKFGLHSLRAGGATEAANRQVADRMFRRHGRWACDASKDLYVKDNLSSLLSASRSLGV
jgi:hypothetical protein